MHHKVSKRMMQISAPKNPYSRRILDNMNSSDALEGNRTGGSDPISSVLQTFRPSSSSSVWETATEALFSAMTKPYRENHHHFLYRILERRFTKAVIITHQPGDVIATPRSRRTHSSPGKSMQ